jgi:hypothetical protein
MNRKIPLIVPILAVSAWSRAQPTLDPKGGVSVCKYTGGACPKCP